MLHSRPSGRLGRDGDPASGQCFLFPSTLSLVPPKLWPGGGASAPPPPPAPAPEVGSKRRRKALPCGPSLGPAGAAPLGAGLPQWTGAHEGGSCPGDTPDADVRHQLLPQCKYRGRLRPPPAVCEDAGLGCSSGRRGEPPAPGLLGLFSLRHILSLGKYGHGLCLLGKSLRPSWELPISQG